MVSVVTVRVLLGRNLQTDLDALDRMVVDSLVGSGDNALNGGGDKEREGNDESMVEEIESQVRDWSNGSSNYVIEFKEDMFQFPRSTAAHMRLAPTALQPLQPTLTTPTGSPLPNYTEIEVRRLCLRLRGYRLF